MSFPTCLLCKKEIELGSRYTPHTARHVKELALFILPHPESNMDLIEDTDAESTSRAETVDFAPSSHDKPKLPSDLPTSSSEPSPAINDSGLLHAKQGQEENEETLTGGSRGG